jgi:hypothetical protein
MYNKINQDRSIVNARVLNKSSRDRKRVPGLIVPSQIFTSDDPAVIRDKVNVRKYPQPRPSTKRSIRSSSIEQKFGKDKRADNSIDIKRNKRSEKKDEIQIDQNFEKSSIFIMNQNIQKIVKDFTNRIEENVNQKSSYNRPIKDAQTNEKTKVIPVLSDSKTGRLDEQIKLPKIPMTAKPKIKNFYSFFLANPIKIQKNVCFNNSDYINDTVSREIFKTKHSMISSSNDTSFLNRQLPLTSKGRRAKQMIYPKLKPMPKESFFLEGKSTIIPVRQKIHEKRSIFKAAEQIDYDPKSITKTVPFKNQYDELKSLKEIYQQAENEQNKVKEKLNLVEDTIVNLRGKIASLTKNQCNKTKTRAIRNEEQINASFRSISELNEAEIDTFVKDVHASFNRRPTLELANGIPKAPTFTSSLIKNSLPSRFQKRLNSNINFNQLMWPEEYKDLSKTEEISYF